MTDPSIKPEPFDIDRDRGGWAYTDCEGLTLNRVLYSTVAVTTLRHRRPPCVVVDDLEARTGAGVAFPADWLRLDWDAAPIKPVPFTDTPGPDGTGEKSSIMIAVPAEGWPSG